MKYEWERDLRNIAYEPVYMKALRKNKGGFSDGQPWDAGMGYYILNRDGKSLLHSPEGREVFSYAADDSYLSKVIEIGGENYFFYTQLLYGYNAVRLRDLSEFKYFPKASGGYLEDLSDSFEETFIWTNIFYDGESRVMAVEGCYWAGEYEVMLYYMPDPMKPFKAMAYLREFLSCGYDLETRDPVKWDENGLIINASEYYTKTESGFSETTKKQIVISREDIISSLKEINI